VLKRLLYLSAGEIMAVCESRRVAVQCRLAVSHGAFGEVTEVEVAWLLWFILLCWVSWVHLFACVRREVTPYERCWVDKEQVGVKM
jgi:hypothetical protein